MTTSIKSSEDDKYRRLVKTTSQGKMRNQDGESREGDKSSQFQTTSQYVMCEYIVNWLGH